MSSTYSQNYFHVIFSTKGRKALLKKAWREDVFRYMAGIINNLGATSMIVNGVDDHVHILFRMKPHLNQSEIVQKVKANSSRFINERKFLPTRFEWQNGFGTFTCSKSHASMVYSYIEKQEQHHSRESFEQEYIRFLDHYGVEYDLKYVFG
jgi:putative transposase